MSKTIGTFMVCAACTVNPAAAQVSSSADPAFASAFRKQFELVKDLAPDMVVEELRLRIELVASRGSAVGAASNDRRVRGFESALLRHVQSALCGDAAARSVGAAQATRPAGPVVDGVQQAAASQRLRTEGRDVAELSALAQRLLESQPPARFCGLRSLDEVR